MSDRDRQIGRWTAIEEDLRAARAGTDVSRDAAKRVEEYLDHNELGPAFETLVVELDQFGVEPSGEEIERLRSAADRMGSAVPEVQYREAWGRVQKRTS